MTSEEDIELWYDDQKERLSDRLALRLKKGKAKERVKKWHAESIRRLNAEYLKKHASHVRSQAIRARLYHYFRMKLFPVKVLAGRLAEKLSWKSRGKEGEEQ